MQAFGDMIHQIHLSLGERVKWASIIQVFISQPLLGYFLEHLSLDKMRY